LDPEDASELSRLPAGPRLPAALKNGDEAPLLPLPLGVPSAELASPREPRVRSLCRPCEGSAARKQMLA
jgi:hypothetical protein